LLSHFLLPFFFSLGLFPLSDYSIAQPGHLVKLFLKKREVFLKTSLSIGIAPIKIALCRGHTAKVSLFPKTGGLRSRPSLKQTTQGKHHQNHHTEPSHRIVNNHFLLSPFVFCNYNTTETLLCQRLSFD
jgi:hypothetical protein